MRSGCRGFFVARGAVFDDGADATIEIGEKELDCDVHPQGKRDAGEPYRGYECIEGKYADESDDVPRCVKDRGVVTVGRDRIRKRDEPDRTQE